MTDLEGYPDLCSAGACVLCTAQDSPGTLFLKPLLLQEHGSSTLLFVKEENLTPFSDVVAGQAESLPSHWLERAYTQQLPQTGAPPQGTLLRGKGMKSRAAGSPGQQLSEAEENSMLKETQIQMQVRRGGEGSPSPRQQSAQPSQH